MSEHYFTENPQSEHNIQTITYNIPNTNETLTLNTDSGVFSRDRVDFGSNLLIKTCVPKANSRVLDIGCGYGVIGISLANRDNSLNILMADVNNRAVKLANENAQINKVKAQAIQSDSFTNISENFDYILINPPIRAGKKVINAILTETYTHLNNMGELYIVVRKRQGGPSMQAFCQELFGNCEKVNKSGGYWILKSVKTE